MASHQAVTTSYLVENLHCPSCVTLIKSTLHDTYGDQVLWVSPNLVTSVVTVEHQDGKTASVRSMKKTLELVGFRVCAVDTVAGLANDLNDENQSHRGECSQDGLSSLWPSRVSAPDMEVTYATHIQNCEACRSAKLDGHSTYEKKVGVPSVSVKVFEDGTYPPEPLQSVVSGDDDGPTSTWRATVSIGGMTCSVCTNTITEEMQKHPWVSKIVVNLVTNSATVEYSGQDRTQGIVDAIEDLGYDAAIDKVVNLSEPKHSTDWREVKITIGGMFCPRCPDRLCKSLTMLGPERLQILDKPSLKQPLIRLRYKPDAPSFTIRHILQASSATDTSLEPSIYHPPTIEDKSRAIRAKHQRALLMREILTLIIAIPTFVLGIVYMSLVSEDNSTRHYLMMPWRSGISRLQLILCLLATPVWLFAADIFHANALKEVRAMWRPGSHVPIIARFYKFGSMNMLISLGTTIAYASSVAQMIVAASSRQKKIPEELIYFDSVVFLTLFLLAGRLIEAYSKSKTGNAVEMLVKLRPDTAILVENDKLQGQIRRKIPLDQLEHGDIVTVMSGASPPADGVIVDGQANFDESSLTGESRLISKVVGDDVFAGTINKSSVVTVRVTSVEGKSMLDQIVDVVREGQAKRAPMERITDMLTSYFVPVVTLIAIITWSVWLALGFSGAVTDKGSDFAGGWVAFAFRFAISVFVVACPCGIGLAAPTAIFVGGGLAAKHGVLVKGGGEAFEKAHGVGCVVFDKTGTLTTGGEPQITDSLIFPGGGVGAWDENALLSALKAVEENSSHPIARAIVGFCGPEMAAAEIDHVEELPGKGMRAVCGRNGEGAFNIAVGNEQLMRDLSVQLSQHVASQLETWRTEAKSLAIVAVRPGDTGPWVLGAALAVSDPIRPEAAAVIGALQTRGTQVWMLSGDNATTARAVAERVGIQPSNVLAEVLPSEKAAKVTYLQSTLHASSGNGHEDMTRRVMVAMVGDGINDSPALTAADVGIAIGSGSDVAISSADFVLAASNLDAVLTLLELSRAVFRRIKFNFGWAIVYNMIAIPFAAGCFYPLKTAGGDHVILPPEFAALAMALSSISVVLGSLCLRTQLPLIGFRPRK